MTIHHDKLAYGKLTPTSENLSEERLAQMLAQLNGEAENSEESQEEENAETSENGAYSAPNSKKRRKK